MGYRHRIHDDDDDDDSLQGMKRPFSPMKALNMEKVVLEIVDKLNGVQWWSSIIRGTLFGRVTFWSFIWSFDVVICSFPRWTVKNRILWPLDLFMMRRNARSLVAKMLWLKIRLWLWWRHEIIMSDTTATAAREYPWLSCLQVSC